MEHAAGVVDDGERTWLIVDRERAAALLTWLTRMRFRLRVDPQDLTGRAYVVGGTAALIAVFAIMIIILAVLSLVVVNALAESPWGVFSITLTIPITSTMVKT